MKTSKDYSTLLTGLQLMWNNRILMVCDRRLRGKREKQSGCACRFSYDFTNIAFSFSNFQNPFDAMSKVPNRIRLPDYHFDIGSKILGGGR